MSNGKKLVQQFIPDGSKIAGAGTWIFSDGSQMILAAQGHHLVEVKPEATTTPKPEPKPKPAPPAPPVRPAPQPAKPAPIRPTPTPAINPVPYFVMAGCVVVLLFSFAKFYGFRTAVLEDVQQLQAERDELMATITAERRKHVQELQRARAEVKQMQASAATALDRIRQAEDRAHKHQAQMDQQAALINQYSLELAANEAEIASLDELLLEAAEGLKAAHTELATLKEALEAETASDREKILKAFVERRNKERAEKAKTWNRGSRTGYNRHRALSNAATTRARLDGVRRSINYWTQF